MAKLLWSAETLLAQLRRTPIVAAAGVTEACVAHCQLILARLRLVIEQMKNALKLERLCSAVAELSQTTGNVGEPCNDPEILRSLPGVGPIVLAALLSEGHDAIAHRNVQALQALAGVVPVTRRSGKQQMVVMRGLHSRNRYAELRNRGHSHARALRSVGGRLIGVACAMLETGERFDPDRAPHTSA
ncbi:transposase [Rhizobium leguminosarum]|uniref:transposase n=1 Tax=Rhizobium leguminosarum TaxID=384 RepID=UPI001C96D5C1|nr:transposase [Rhizobium leguminosarum]MBY5699738.1 IS110 family transposase [Rhizobium leguminosarum]